MVPEKRKASWNTIGPVAVRQPDVTGAGRLEPGDDLEQRGLARSGRADHGDDPPGRHVEVDTVDGRPLLVGVGEPDGVELHGQTARCGGDRRLRIGLDRFVQHRPYPAPSGQRVRQLRQRVADQAQREHEQREQVDEAGQLADGDGAGLDADGPQHDQPDVGQRRQHVEQRFERPAQADGADACRAQVAGQGRQPLRLALLSAVRLDELHAVEALVDAGREVPEVTLGGVVVGLDAPLVVDVEADQQREDGHRGGAQHEVGGEQPDRRHDEQQHRAGGERDRRQHRDGGVGVDAGAGDEVAVRPPLVPCQRLAHEPVDNALAERSGDLPLRPTGPRPADHHTGCPQQADADDERDGDHHVATAPPRPRRTAARSRCR